MTDPVSAIRARLHEAVKQITAYRQHASLCEIDKTDFCTCGLREAMERLDKTWRDDWATLTQQLAQAEQKIAEIAVNCPSCGRHDFGLLSGPIVKLREVQAERDSLAAEVARLQEILSKNADSVR